MFLQYAPVTLTAGSTNISSRCTVQPHFDCDVTFLDHDRCVDHDVLLVRRHRKDLLDREVDKVEILPVRSYARAVATSATATTDKLISSA